MSRGGSRAHWLLVLALIAWINLPTGLLGQNGAVQWIVDKDVSQADKKQILQLADRVGIHNPQVISRELIRMPLGCFALRVQSQVGVSGSHRTWSEAFVERADSANYCRAASSPSTRVGTWSVGPMGVLQRDAWRVSDGSWYFDVALDEGVTYETAAKIVLAIKRRTFVDRRTHIEGGPFGNELLLGGPANLRKIGDRYELRTGSAGGLVLRIALEGKQVVLLAADTWIS